MDKEQIMKIILAEEQLLLDQAREFQEAFGSADEATERAVNKWIAISNLIDKINEETN
jgi:hypothetical protein